MITVAITFLGNVANPTLAEFNPFKNLRVFFDKISTAAGPCSNSRVAVLLLQLVGLIRRLHVELARPRPSSIVNRLGHIPCRLIHRLVHNHPQGGSFPILNNSTDKNLASLTARGNHLNVPEKVINTELLKVFSVKKG